MSHAASAPSSPTRRTPGHASRSSSTAQSRSALAGSLGRCRELEQLRSEDVVRRTRRVRPIATHAPRIGAFEDMTRRPGNNVQGMSTHEPGAEDATDAFVDGDRASVRGTAQAALRHRDFRVVWARHVRVEHRHVDAERAPRARTGTRSRTRRPTSAILFFAQLGPLLLFSNLGGVLADVARPPPTPARVPGRSSSSSRSCSRCSSRRRIPTRCCSSCCVLVDRDRRTRSARPALELDPADARPQAGPARRGLAPVGADEPVAGDRAGDRRGDLRRDRAPPRSSCSTRSRTCSRSSPCWRVEYPRHPAPSGGPVARTRSEGFRVAQADPLVRRVLVTLVRACRSSRSPSSASCRRIAADNLDVGAEERRVRSAVRGLRARRRVRRDQRRHVLRATVPKARLVRPALVGVRGRCSPCSHWCASRGSRSSSRPSSGYAYFVVITSLSTVLQQHVDDAVRGRVMALWIMGFGGTVPVGVLIAGPTRTGDVDHRSCCSSARWWRSRLAAYADLAGAGRARLSDLVSAAGWTLKGIAVVTGASRGHRPRGGARAGGAGLRRGRDDAQPRRRRGCSPTQPRAAACERLDVTDPSTIELPRRAAACSSTTPPWSASTRRSSRRRWSCGGRCSRPTSSVLIEVTRRRSRRLRRAGGGVLCNVTSSSILAPVPVLRALPVEQGCRERDRREPARRAGAVRHPGARDHAGADRHRHARRLGAATRGDRRPRRTRRWPSGTRRVAPTPATRARPPRSSRARASSTRSSTTTRRSASPATRSRSGSWTRWRRPRPTRQLMQAMLPAWTGGDA